MERRDSGCNGTPRHGTESSANAQQLLHNRQGISSRMFVRKSSGMKSGIIRGRHGLMHEVRNTPGQILNEYDNL